MLTRAYSLKMAEEEARVRVAQAVMVPLAHVQRAALAGRVRLIVVASVEVTPVKRHPHD